MTGMIRVVGFFSGRICTLYLEHEPSVSDSHEQLLRQIPPVYRDG